MGGTKLHSYAVGVGIIEFLGCFVTPPTHSDMPINQIMDHWLGSDQICEECMLMHARMLEELLTLHTERIISLE